MLVKLRRWLWRVPTSLLLALLIIGAVLWGVSWRDLNQPARRAAWDQLQRHGNPSYVIWAKENREGRDFLTPSFDPHAAMLWLAAGFDPNGDFCAERGERPDAFENAIWRPLGFCRPPSGQQIPFIFVASYGYTQEARDVARLMIAAGADVNKVSPDGILALRNAVVRRNEEMVNLLLRAGADPLLKPKYSEIGDLSSALEAAERLPRDAVADRIREMLRSAAEERLKARPRS